MEDNEPLLTYKHQSLEENRLKWPKIFQLIRLIRFFCDCRRGLCLDFEAYNKLEQVQTARHVRLFRYAEILQQYRKLAAEFRD